IKIDFYENEKEKKLPVFSGKKKFFPVKKGKLIIDWLRKHFDKKEERIAYLRIQGTDVQQSNTIFVTSQPSESDFRESKVTEITKNNLIQTSIYYVVRKCIEHTWINHNDQFLFPKNKWKEDMEFQNDCLAYTLFSNNIQSKHGVNHWIPFLEKEINARDKFDSHFMISFISGKLMPNRYSHLFEQDEDKVFIKREFSTEAKAVFAAGKKLWTYYHAQPKCNVNASLYDIREHFQGRNTSGKMNNKSNDETYNVLIADLRSALRTLAEKIEPKVYEHGFLKR
ncbi:MAG: hypothetical protein LBI05_07140, partial [Planctomycetaceae bacterium]|nr:hypothetical protein [Planctomycetaceae bacterium]